MLIQVQYAEGGTRYTYNAPRTVKIGDRVKVPAKLRGGYCEGIATVVGDGHGDPDYAGDIKAIIEVLPREVEVTYKVHDPEKLREWGNAVLAGDADPSTRANVSALLYTLALRAENERI